MKDPTFPKPRPIRDPFVTPLPEVTEEGRLADESSSSRVRHRVTVYAECDYLELPEFLQTLQRSIELGVITDYEVWKLRGGEPEVDER